MKEYGNQISIEHSLIDKEYWIIFRTWKDGKDKQSNVLQIEKALWDSLSSDIKVGLIESLIKWYG